MAAIYSNGVNRWNILGFNFTKRDALSSVYKISIWYQPYTMRANGSGVLGSIFPGGGHWAINHMHPYNVTFDKRGPKARAERRRCEVCLGGSGGMPPRKYFEFKVSEMPFPRLWGEDLTEI